MPRPSHTFRLEKSTIWTNGDPRGWFISVYQHKGSDTAGTAEIRNKQHSSSGKSKNEELVYGTSMAHWYKQRLFLPPGFTFGRYGENDAVSISRAIRANDSDFESRVTRMSSKPMANINPMR